MSRWVHFSEKPLGELHDTLQVETVSTYSKPRGFWVSDENDDRSWSAWCAEEDYLDTTKQIANEIELTAAVARLLTLSTVAELESFSDRYGVTTWYGDGIAIDWQHVALGWAGILITPWPRGIRHHASLSWHYGWDCASGCIWDTSTIRAKASVPA